ncbi:MAG: SH3 domain-containing protein [Thermoanaerobaculia bacterium]
MKNAALFLLVPLLALACRSAPRPAIDTLGARSADEAWTRLEEESRRFQGASSFLSVRPEGARRFDATLAIDAQGRLALSAISPLGTTLFRLFAEGDRVLVLNDHEKSWWRGSFEEFSLRTGLFAGVPIVGASDLGRLLFGLPIEAETVREGEWRIGSSGLRYRVGRTGIEEVAAGPARIFYEPAVYPPVGVRIVAPGSSMTLEHLEIVSGSGPIEIPDPDPAWKFAVPGRAR